MTAPNSMTSSVEVATDLHTAFTVFTEELDCWWIQGPINFFDAARAYPKRIEPGVGGRIIELYDGDSGEGLEVARITVWDPPARLAWQSSVDDVQIDAASPAMCTFTFSRRPKKVITRAIDEVFWKPAHTSRPARTRICWCSHHHRHSGAVCVRERA